MYKEIFHARSNFDVSNIISSSTMELFLFIFSIKIIKLLLKNAFQMRLMVEKLYYNHFTKRLKMKVEYNYIRCIQDNSKKTFLCHRCPST